VFPEYESPVMGKKSIPCFQVPFEFVEAKMNDTAQGSL